MVDEGLRRTALVMIEELRAVAARLARKAALHIGGRMVGFVARGDLARVGAPLDAGGAAVVADTAIVDVVDHHGVVVHVGHARDVHVGHGAVVEEAVTIPVATDVADADVAEAVVDAAVKADMRSPIAGMPEIDAVHETPIARGPQRAGVGRQHPRARHPEIAVAVQAPVSRHPHIAIAGGGRLGIDGQGRRRLRTAVERREVGVGGIAVVIGGRGRGGRWRVGLRRRAGTGRHQQNGGQRTRSENPGSGIHGMSFTRRRGRHQ
ncbi:Uncharacterised protein [Achromobacter xylosoxidans]|nr:Uncharacterised protein [Achromobacter xylosoxidans]